MTIPTSRLTRLSSQQLPNLYPTSYAAIMQIVTKSAEILNSVHSLRGRLRVEGWEGPYVLYVGKDFVRDHLEQEYLDSKSRLQRILEIEGIQRVEQLDFLPERYILLVQLEID